MDQTPSQMSISHIAQTIASWISTGAPGPHNTNTYSDEEVVERSSTSSTSVADSDLPDESGNGSDEGEAISECLWSQLGHNSPDIPELLSRSAKWSAHDILRENTAWFPWPGKIVSIGLPLLSLGLRACLGMHFGYPSPPAPLSILGCPN